MEEEHKMEMLTLPVLLLPLICKTKVSQDSKFAVSMLANSAEQQKICRVKQLYPEYPVSILHARKGLYFRLALVWSYRLNIPSGVGAQKVLLEHVFLFGLMQKGIQCTCSDPALWCTRQSSK